jgi:menaquinone-dependent protoporphyrinogen oxidase
VASVLVAYASRHGSTEGVAERIARRLRERGHEVALRPVAEAGEVASQEAVVVGSPVYDQAWLPEFDAFVRDAGAALASRRVWLFSVGTFGDTKPLVGRLMPREPRDIGEVRRALRPVEYRVFAGIIDRHQWPGASRLLFHAFGGRFGDNRDWAAIDAWADRIAGSLAGAEGAAG